MVRRAGLLLLFLLMAFAGRAQEFDAFARIRVSPREVVVRQPFRVTISVHTATWYTSPLQFKNLRIQDAFIIPFTRTLSSVAYIQKKQYSTLTFYYLVIPYETGALEIPSLEVIATTPPLDDYKGVPITLRTRAQKINVKEVPENEEGVWMVAKNMSFRESWDKALEHLKVGDVLERSIVLNASGTLPSLIQPLDIEQPAGVSLYPAPPELKDTRTGQDVNGRRTEHYSYLFEEEGEVEIPETVISWWNPATKRINQRIIPARILEIAPNPDLDMMLSLKDSLDALQASTLPVEEKPPFPWKKYAIWLLGGLLMLYALIRVSRAAFHWARHRRKAYLASPRYYLHRCRRALRKGDARAFTNALYTWVDQSRKAGQAAAVYAYLEAEDRKRFIRFMEGIMEENNSAPPLDWKQQMPTLLRSLKNSI